MHTNTDRDTHKLKPTHIEAILQRHLQCDIAICMISVHKSTDWDSPLGYKQVISHYTRRISYECRIQECRIQEIQECYICTPLLDILYVCVRSYMYNLFHSINLPTSSTLLCKVFNLYI